MNAKKFKNRRILIVDDEPKNLKILKIRLEKDYELLEAASGEEALTLIENFDPALVLTDIMMTGIDGYELTRQIKSNPKTAQAKVILVSGKAMIEEKLEGYHSGAEDYITKPFNGEELKAKVEVFIKLFNLEAELQVVNSSLETEVQARSEQLITSERMAFVGMHTGEIVHNLKNPLAIIKGYLFKLKSSHPDLRELEKIENATDKILDITKNILSSFSQEFKVDMAEFKINEVIEWELEFLKNLDLQYKNRVTTQLDLKSESSIFASRSHYSQIIGNLVKNAVEAMTSSEKQILTIRTYDQEGSVCVHVVDSGEGISEENLAHIFEPLFTTKDGKEGRPLGNGLGLPFCKRMVEAYGGDLQISSRINQGTEVKLVIPTQAKKSSSPKAA